MGRRNEHSREELQEMAISAAEAIIASEGLRGLTARKVAGQLGYSAGSLYMVFNGLDELILHVKARTLSRLADNLDAHTMTDATPLAALRALAHGYLKFAMQEQTRWRAVFDHQLNKETKLPCWYTDTVNADGPGAKTSQCSLTECDARRAYTQNHCLMECRPRRLRTERGTQARCRRCKRSVPGAR